MESYIIITDSCSEITSNMAKKLGISVIPFTVRLSDKDYLSNDETEITYTQFFSSVKSGLFPVPLIPDKESYMKIFESILAEGKDIIYLSVSGKLLPGFSNACEAKKLLETKYPDRRISVLDTKTASVGESLIAVRAAEKMKEGAGFEEAISAVEKMAEAVSTWFYVEDINHLKRCGMVSVSEPSPAVAMKVRPILAIEDGSVVIKSKMRGNANAEKYIIDKAVEKGIDKTVLISSAANDERSERIKESFLERNAGEEFIILPMGITSGSFFGPGTGAVAYL
ncbi:MAG: DegV family protein [Eubacterium sp.]|nr:DegV family protein [Eubacterium sp.]